MVKLKRVCEDAIDSSRTSIMYNLNDNLQRKGWKTNLSDKGIRVEFSYDEDYDPKKQPTGKAWLKDNKDKDFVFKGKGLKGSYILDINKRADGKRELVVKNVMVDGSDNLMTKQKKLKATKPANGKLTGRSVKLFEYPEPYTITNLVSPTFHSFLRKLNNKIKDDAALALSEVIELNADSKSKTESLVYFIDYDENFNCVNEGYLREAEEKPQAISWKDGDVQKAITDAVKGLKIDQSKTTSKELIFTHNGKNGSLHLQGYMLVLDTDTDDEIPPTSYPVKDKNNLTLDNLLSTIKTVFSRRESAVKSVKESVKLDENAPEQFFVLRGDTVNGDIHWDDLIEGFDVEHDAARLVDRLSLRESDPDIVYGYTEGVALGDDHSVFWDALDKGWVRVTIKDSVTEKRMDEAVEDHIDYHYQDPKIDDSPVFQDVAKSRFMEALSNSLLIAPKFTGECNNPYCDNPDVVWIYLSPSYAINQLSDIVVPLCLDNRTLSMPCVDVPEPDAVFNGDYSENSLTDYCDTVQDFILNDAPVSEIGQLDMDNTDELKAMVVSFINSMADDYQKKQAELDKDLEINGDGVLNESRYFIVPGDTNLESTDSEVEKLTPLGFTDLTVARNELKNMADSGRYNFDLKILDTNFSNNKEKWTIL